MEQQTIAAERWVVFWSWLLGAAMLGLCIALALTKLCAANGAGWFLVPKDQPGAVGVKLDPAVLVAFGLAFAFNAWRYARVRVVISVDRVTIVNPYRRYVIARSDIIGVDLGRTGHVNVVTVSGRKRAVVEALELSHYRRNVSSLTPLGSRRWAGLVAGSW